MILPSAALQQHIAVLGKTGSGKTFAIKGIVEQLLHDNRRVCIVDPTGAWWGLRSSRDGKSPGFPILVLGGDHGDLPLPALGGAAVARLVVEQGVNLVADTTQLTVGERTRWFIDFGSTLYRVNRTPLHLVIDEAHNFAPQGKVPDPDTGKMLHAANTLASGGRSRGIRLAMITQRPQKLHKDTLTSADTLIAMRVLAPHDRMAVEDWIKGCGDIAQGKEVLNSLASLQRGEGWIWYPEGKFLKRVHFPEIRTFDSSATPTDGHSVRAPKAVSDIDLSAIKEAMADAVKQAEDNDPKILRKRIAVLEAAAKSGTKTDADRAYKDGYDTGKMHAKGDVAQAFDDGFRSGTNTAHQYVRQRLDSFADDMHAFADEIALHIDETKQRPIRAVPKPQPTAPRETSPVRVSNGNGEAQLSKAERLALTALAQYPGGRSSVQVAMIAGYAHNGGGFRNALGALRTMGYIEGGNERMVATPAGIAALGSFEPLPTGAALLEHWYRQLSKAERKVLECLAAAHPRTLSVAQVANQSGYEANGGGFRNALGRLRTLELISGRAELKANEDLFA